jgi:hypothetical protein
MPASDRKAIAKRLKTRRITPLRKDATVARTVALSDMKAAAITLRKQRLMVACKAQRRNVV